MCEGWRRSMPYLLGSGIVLAGYLAAMVIAFVFDIKVRSAVYLGISALLLYLIIAIPILLGQIGSDPKDVFDQEHHVLIVG